MRSHTQRLPKGSRYHPIGGVVASVVVGVDAVEPLAGAGVVPLGGGAQCRPVVVQPRVDVVIVNRDAAPTQLGGRVAMCTWSMARSSSRSPVSRACARCFAAVSAGDVGDGADAAAISVCERMVSTAASAAECESMSPACVVSAMRA